MSDRGCEISILMPVFDTPAEYLAECWDSIRAQTFADWELVLIDDGSRTPIKRTASRQSPLMMIASPCPVADAPPEPSANVPAPTMAESPTLPGSFPR